MKILGLQKLTLLDYPEKTACTVFFGGCNFRCPFCHNASVVLEDATIEEISRDEIISFLKKRKSVLDGVCVTGGEPLLQDGLRDFLYEAKSLDYQVKLDTNGYLPEKMKALVDDSLVDYVAMDIKNKKSKYAQTAGAANLDLMRICESVDYLMSGKIPFEFRTTAVRELHSVDDFREISRWIAGANRYFIQPFADSGDLIDSGLTPFSTFSAEELSEILDAVRAHVPGARLRG